ncbi:MAG: hypothetical protein R3A49_08650 [Acidimicrobiia bacterium]
MNDTMVLAAMVLGLMALAALPRLWSGLRRWSATRTGHHPRHGSCP